MQWGGSLESKWFKKEGIRLEANILSANNTCKSNNAEWHHNLEILIPGSQQKAAKW